MKKLYYLIILTVILGVVLTGCFLSNVGQVPTNEQSGITYLTKGVPGVPDVFTLYAGQHIDVGTVSVWDDCVDLYVKYETTGGWVMTETHLAVATNLNDPDGIPQTKKGNPIPGQFPYQCCYDETEEEWLFVKKPDTLTGTCDADGEEDATLTEITYIIPFGLGPELYIAAHAVVVNTETSETKVDLEWWKSVEDKDSICSASGIGGAVADGLLLDIDKTQEVWDRTTAGQDWAYWDLYDVDGITTYKFQVRHFQTEFELPKEIKPYNVEDLILFSPYHLADIIPINDNIYVYLNEDEIGIRGTSYPGATFDWAVSPAVGWYVPGSFSADGPQNLIAGSNVIDIVAEECAGWGGMGKLGLKLIWHQEETAWAGMNEGEILFPGKNWATYFTYNIITELTISSEDLAGPYNKDEDGEFSVKTVNPSCGTEYPRVIFKYTIWDANLSDIVSFEYHYFDGANWVWGNMPKYEDGLGNVIGYFGPLPDCFLMEVNYSEETTFKINIGIVGTFSVTITLINCDNNEVLTTFTENVVVNPIP